MIKLPPYKKIPVFIKNSQSWDRSYYNLDKVHAAGFRGQGIKIAVIDTGINFVHKEFDTARQDSRLEFYDLTTDKNPMDFNGHGTWCCSKVIGSNFGVAPDCDLVSFKSLNAQGGGTISDVFESAHRAMDMKCKIISMSLGWECGDFVREMDYLVDRANKEGVLILSAAGNDGKIHDIDAPGCHDGIISVGGFNARRERSVFSDFGVGLDLYAPGDAKAAYLGNGVAHLSGTSMATPIAAASIALVYNYLIEKHGIVNYQTLKKIVTCQ